MSISSLDQIVKGAPLPGTSIPKVISRSPSPAPARGSDDSAPPRLTPPLPPSNPLVTLPSSPPQIYLNLLILEASLRSQYLTLRTRRRQHNFFLLVLTIWITCFFYALFLRPREDGSGVGGSVYWVVEMAEKVALMGGIVTGILLWGTGQWDRGVRWPRRWVGVANRGLRNINAKIVVIKGSWWRELLGLLSALFPYSSFFPSLGSSFHNMDLLVERHGSNRARTENHDSVFVREEDLSPGGDFIKLLLLPKPFSADFRENWELYRIEYWEKENERRANLRRQLKRLEKEFAREHGGWFWWIGWRRRNISLELSQRSGDPEKNASKHRSENDIRRRRSVSRSTSHSRTTSRSSTPANADIEERPLSTRLRRGSSNASGSERRRKLKSSTSSDSTHTMKLTPIESRSSLLLTPEMHP